MSTTAKVFRLSVFRNTGTTILTRVLNNTGLLAGEADFTDVIVSVYGDKSGKTYPIDPDPQPAMLWHVTPVNDARWVAKFEQDPGYNLEFNLPDRAFPELELYRIDVLFMSGTAKVGRAIGEAPAQATEPYGLTP